jgi:DNA repair protein RadC
MASSEQPTDERPLADIRLGLMADPAAMTDAELLALVIGQADKRRSSLKNATRLLDAFGGLKELAADARGAGFIQQNRMSETVGSRVLAVAEIIRRCSGSRTGTKAESLALAYLQTAADTLEGLAGNPSPELIQQAADLMRRWRGFALRLLS